MATQRSMQPSSIDGDQVVATLRGRNLTDELYTDGIVGADAAPRGAEVRGLSLKYNF